VGFFFIHTVIKFAFILTLGTVALIFIIQQLLGFTLTTQASTSRIKYDIKKLRDEIAQLLKDLSPWDENDLELISLQISEIQKNVKLNQIVRGYINNIYQEKVVAFAYKNYYGKKGKALLYARNSTSEFYYKISTKSVDIYKDEKQLGTLFNDGGFIEKGQEDIKAKVSQSDTMSLIPVEIDGKKVASLTNPIDSTYANTRAVTILKDINETDGDLLTSLVLFEIIHRTNTLQ